MMIRRDAIRLLGSVLTEKCLAARGLSATLSSGAFAAVGMEDSAPPLLEGTPFSPERIAFIEEFKRRSTGLEKKFQAHTYKSGWVMPYRLFRPKVSAKAPLVVYLHGSGGLGNDNLKQLSLGNIFGTRVWLLPENQEHFPCYVLVPQTDRGWVRYDPIQWTKGVAEVIPGLGEGARVALEIIDALCHQFEIDEQRIFVMGQSMGGAGTWNMITNRSGFFAAAVICCGSVSADDGTGSITTPLWNFHGDLDRTVPVSVSRDRIAARQKAGGRPTHTEYAGVDHNVWEWAFTEPELVKWLFSQRRT